MDNKNYGQNINLQPRSERNIPLPYPEGTYLSRNFLVTRYTIGTTVPVMILQTSSGTKRYMFVNDGATTIYLGSNQSMGINTGIPLPPAPGKYDARSFRQIGLSYPLLTGNI